MVTVVNSGPTSFVFLGKQLRNEREAKKLTLAQAATALGISPITLDGWEQGRKPQISVSEARESYDRFRINTNSCRKSGNNLLFGVFPIRIARDILELSVDQMAEKVGYSRSSWAKMEANARNVPPEKIEEIEILVNSAWNSACTGR